MAERRVGNFENPNSKQTDWLDPSTVSMIVLQSKMITKVGDTNATSIDLKLNSDEARKMITLHAEYNVSNTKYQSKKIDIPEETFAIEFSKVVYSETAVDDTQMIKDAVDEAVKDLSKTLMDAGILMGGMKFGGIGFVLVDGDKVLSIEEIDFEYRVEGGKPIHELRIHNCVGQASLNNLSRPQIDFYTGTHRFQATELEVLESAEGKIKTYLVKVPSIDLKLNDTMPEHETFEHVNYENEDFLDGFIKARKCLLDDENDDKDLDERFSFL